MVRIAHVEPNEYSVMVDCTIQNNFKDKIMIQSNRNDDFQG